MVKVLMIAVGGGIGSVLRYALSVWGQRLTEGPFPLGTLIVNVIGCLAIGFLNYALTGPVLIREEYRVALVIGLIGGFTTFSSFGWETFVLVNDGQFLYAAANVLLSVATGLVAVLTGYRMAERLLGV